MPTPTKPDDLTRWVHDALAHLYDPGYLETHPLGDLRGRALHRALLEAVEALKPTPARGHPSPTDPRAARSLELLRLRYLEALPVEEVQKHLLIGRSEYYRAQERALTSLAALTDRAAAVPVAPASSTRGGDGATGRVRASIGGVIPPESR